MTNKKRGAEATVEIKNDKVIKQRIPKKYRHNELDKRIRHDRTNQEHNITKKANQHNINSPKILEKEEYTLEIEKIPGRQLKEVIDDKNNLAMKLGIEIGKLHDLDIIHGDLTTSNAIVNEEEVYLIDFGLSFHSKRTEDYATDLHLLKNVLKTSHSEKHEELWENILEGYKSVSNEKDIETVLEEIEKRARYK